MEEALNLCGARVATRADEAIRATLSIRQGRVYYGASSSARNIDASSFLILPGLINSHDHLELNLFPRLGHGPYPNARLWAEDIYQPGTSPIKEHLTVPKPVRLFWGAIKNLLNGVTTVAHHNPYVASSFESHFPVRVVKRFGWAHSLAFSPDWEVRYRQTPAGVPFIMHAAEGSDNESRAELARMNQAGALNAATVLVHGVALDAGDAALLRKRHASLVWCPTSNLFTLGRTISPDVLDSGVPVALGTDSALTSVGDLLDELHAARQFVSEIRLYEMVTTRAADILRIDGGAGAIQNGGRADLVLVEDHGDTPAEALLRLDPKAVFVDGRIHLASAGIAQQLRASESDGFEPLTLSGRGRWLLPFPVSKLLADVTQFLGARPRLAGKEVFV